MNTPARPPILATCHGCGLTWNDAEPTSYTPAPSARCPFEAWHHDDGTPTSPDEIPATHPVRPIANDPAPPAPIAADVATEQLEALAERAESYAARNAAEFPETAAHQRRAAAEWRAELERRRATDDHSAGRRAEILEAEAPHLLAPNVDADLHELAHELADAAINGAAGGYAETDEESDRRAALRDQLERRLYAIATAPTRGIGAVLVFDHYTTAELEQLATDHPETAGAVIAELARRLELERPQPTTPEGSTAHDLARAILTPRPLEPLTKTALYDLAEQLARLVLRADPLEEDPYDEPAGAATDPRPDPRTHPEFWTE